MSRTLCCAVAGALSLMGCARTPPTDAGAYRVVLELDRAGKVLSGSKPDLERAVRAGQKIRVGWALDWDEDGDIDIEHWADAAFLSIYKGEVFTQLSRIQQQIPDQQAPDIKFAPEESAWVGQLGTDGILRGFFVEHKQPRDFRVSSWWYTQEPLHSAQ